MMTNAIELLLLGLFPGLVGVVLASILLRERSSKYPEDPAKSANRLIGR